MQFFVGASAEITNFFVNHLIFLFGVTKGQSLFVYFGRPSIGLCVFDRVTILVYHLIVDTLDKESGTFCWSFYDRRR